MSRRTEFVPDKGMVLGGGISWVKPPPPGGYAPKLVVPPQGFVTLRTVDMKYAITVMFDETEPVLTRGAPNFQTVDGPWRTQSTYWAGHAADTLEIQIIVDGFPNKSVEAAIDEIEVMMAPRREGRASGGPKAVQVAGQLPGTDQLWLMTGITQTKAIWDRNRRIRQHLTISFQESHDLSKLTAGSRKNTRAKNGKLKRRKDHTVKKGETLTSIAQDVLGQSKRWKDIAKLNPHKKGKKKTPRRSPTDVKVGEKLKMPQD
ncbi:LysM peptidoglycan-binding domain-containing protein [Patulibacter minatonensis]|uniref:LysM peptidoglycan-binding domain-containing protein n=1 Tax=Patulibacter minatonensis TaxID=298163 RepID=UPI00047CA28B|nr:LysM domain-containing protein [Patulibacter minatonensis]